MLTLDEIRDDLARRAGWREEHAPSDTGNWRWARTMRDGRVERREDHPFPLNLDAAADAMPEGWHWRRKITPLEDETWEAYCESPMHFIRMAGTGDEIDDRFRLAHAAVVAMEKGKSDG